MTETERINRLIFKGGLSGMTQLQFYAAEIEEWKISQKRLEQIKGIEYYKNLHDIRYRQRTAIGKDGKLKEITNLPNNKIVDNQYALMVDQKTNYLVGKPFTVNCEDKNYREQLEKVFDKSFRRMFKYVVKDSLNCAIGWIYPYYTADGELAFKRFPECDVLPFWSDDEHTRLDSAVRLYEVEVWEGYQKKIAQKVEIFKPDGLYRYGLEGGQLISDPDAEEYTPYITGADGQTYGWGRVPLIPFKYDEQETTLLSRVKSLQDGINTVLSDFQNDMQENARNTILVLKNYDGEDLGEFRENLSTYAAVKISGDGGLEPLTIEVNAENYQSILDMMKKKLIENARGYDCKDERLSGNPNQMNIQSMYSDIDLDASGMETEYQAAFDDLLYFVDQYIANAGGGDHEADEVEIIFNRDILINESESIDNCVKSVGMLSDETLIENHPFVKNVTRELDRISKQRDSEVQDYHGAFSKSM